MQGEWQGAAQGIPSVGTPNCDILLPELCYRMYNAITREMEPELLHCCRKFGLRIVAYNPLA